MPARSRKHVGILVVISALISITFLSCTEGKAPQAGEKLSEDKMAVVNGIIISKADFDQEISRIQQQFSSRGTPLSDSKLSEIKKEVLDYLVNTELLYQKSQKNEIKVEETAIDKQFELMKKRFPSETDFKNHLSKMSFSEASIKSQIRRGMSIQQLIEKEVAQKVAVSDQETKDYYDNNPDEFKQSEQVRASHILIKFNPDADESQKAEARKKLEDIKLKLQKGKDFAALAKEFSQGPSASKGGDLGYFGRGQMVKPFEETAFTLKPNQVSEIVQTKFGYHLMKVFDKKPGTTIPYKAIKTSLANNLKREKIQKGLPLYIEKLKEGTKIERPL